MADLFTIIAGIIASAQPPRTAEEILREAESQARGSDRQKGSGRKAAPIEPSDSSDPEASLSSARGGRRENQSESSKKEVSGSEALSVSQGENAGEPKTNGFDVETINKEFALVILGNTAKVFQWQTNAALEDQLRVITVETFKQWFSNRFVERRQADGKLKAVTWGTAWLSSKPRRQYRGVEFHPNPDGAPGTDGYLNLWSGFAIEPAPESDARKYKTFRDHVLVNICAGRADHFKWLWAWFAHMVQRPRERLGKAIVMRGAMGAGKTIVGKIIGQLFPRHYFCVDDARYVTGQFNAHMATCLLLQADEAVWAGDKAAEGRLKGLITSEYQQIESKGVDPIRLRNYVRLIMTSNEEWVVPAGKDERRFVVFDVDPRCAQQNEYFAEMQRELDGGGLAALLADLLAFDLSSVDLYRSPLTDALLEQKIRSLPSIDAWWFERLMSGTVTGRAREWKQQIPTLTLYRDYIRVSDQVGIRRKSEQTAFGMRLHKLLPTLGNAKRMDEVWDDDKSEMRSDRVHCYLLPPLQEARAAFEKVVNQSVQWPKDDGEGEGESREELEF